MNPLSHEQRVEALCRLEGTSSYPQARMRLDAIDRLLVLQEDFCESDVRRILAKRELPLPLERALELYVMMGRVMKLCEPKGQAIGPTCVVRQIKFEELTYAEALDLKNGIGFRLALKFGGSLKELSSFSGLDLLDAEEKELYLRLKPCFTPQAKPTLKLLAARLLRNSEDKTFSDRAIIRYIAALKSHNFTDPDHRRDYLISSVNSFGAHKKSARESVRYAVAEALSQMGQTIRQCVIPAMVQSAQVVAQSIRQFELSHIALRQTLPLIAQSASQVPIIVPEFQRAIAEACRSLPQTLSLLQNLDFDPRQN